MFKDFIEMMAGILDSFGEGFFNSPGNKKKTVLEKVSTLVFIAVILMVIAAFVIASFY